MKFFPLDSTAASLKIVCLVALLSPAEKVIYHQTMSPTWLEAHASYIDSSHTATTEQLTFNAGSAVWAALFKVPMIPASVLQYSTPLTVKIVVSYDVSIGTTQDSNILYGVSDGTSVVGITTRKTDTYGSDASCHGFESNSGTALSEDGWISATSSKVSETFYPGQFVITLKLDERWGSCYTAHDGGFVKTTTFTKRLMLNKGLTLEVYKQSSSETVGIKYVEVTIFQAD